MNGTACYSKVKYRTEEDARDALIKLKKKIHRPGRKIPKKYPRRSYLCPHCNNWHLTSQFDYTKPPKK